MANFASAIQRVESGENLTTEEMEALVGSMLAEEVQIDSPQADLVRRLLLGLRKKGETTDELVGAALAMRAHMTPIQRRRSVSDSRPLTEADFLLDTCGTGGSGSGTFNISTAAAIVISAAGVPVAKHGNRRATSRSGSADVLAELGVRIESDREIVRRSLEELRLCFCFAPVLHPAMRHVGAIRRSLSVPTMFNLLGPLCNPAGATHQLLGTGRADVQQKLAEALARLGTRRSIVVRGEDGQDEVTLDGNTIAIEVDFEGNLKTHRWTSATFGLEPAGVDAMQASDPAESAAIIRDIFGGAPGPCRDIVIANAAAGLWLVGRAETLLLGARLAADTIDSGAALIQLNRFAELTGGTTLGDTDSTSQGGLQISGGRIAEEIGMPSQRFSMRELELAAELKNAGLAWQPEPGHFVFDSDRVLPHSSPFQDRVFFILDLKHFLRYAGSIDELTRRMMWLPSWWDARRWLRAAGVEDATVADFLAQRQAITRGEELVVLYEMILERLGN